MRNCIRFFGLLDLFTFARFIIPKVQVFYDLFQIKQPVKIGDYLYAGFSVFTLMLLLTSGILLLILKKTGLYISFLTVPFRLYYYYISFGSIYYFLSLLPINAFAPIWLVIIVIFETARHIVQYIALKSSKIT